MHLYLGGLILKISDNTSSKIMELYKQLQDSKEKIANIEQERVSALRDNAQAMKDKEQSFENRMLGGATMAATGIGGMMALSGLSEQKADTASEEDMRAYLATFACDYGNGQRVSGGTTGVELPGANDLIDKYTAYATLANSLKERKTALNLKPGLESEIVIDKATTGLYDDVGTGIGSGAYASISRALLNPDSEDAKKWAEIRDKSAKNFINDINEIGVTKEYAVSRGVGTHANQSQLSRQETDYIRQLLNDRDNFIARNVLQSDGADGNLGDNWFVTKKTNYMFVDGTNTVSRRINTIPINKLRGKSVFLEIFNNGGCLGVLRLLLIIMDTQNTILCK